MVRTEDISLIQSIGGNDYDNDQIRKVRQKLHHKLVSRRFGCLGSMLASRAGHGVSDGCVRIATSHSKTALKHQPRQDI